MRALAGLVTSIHRRRRPIYACPREDYGRGVTERGREGERREKYASELLKYTSMPDRKEHAGLHDSGKVRGRTERKE